ncbi:LysR family transcriptional regulator [bacterium]|nr:LysR family transcriptional regulator [bacterium]
MQPTADKLSRIDVNLVISLAVLLEERHVTRAAERLFITQPAMSRTLTRLRDMFDDPLFTRSAKGLTPTPRAYQLEKQLPVLLDNLANLIVTNIFDPYTCTEKIRIAIPEPFDQTIYGELAKKISIQAPQMSIDAKEVDSSLEERLANGSLDFAITRNQYHNDNIEETLLATSAPTLIARKNHPLAKKTFTLDDAKEYPFILSFNSESSAENALIDKLLNQGKKAPKILFQTGHLLSALQVLKSTNGIMPGPQSLLASSLMSDFVNIGLPNKLKAINVPIILLQHHRTINSAAHSWIKDAFIEIIEKKY